MQLALHQARAFCRQAKDAGASTGVLFVDLTEAFYRILREAPLGGEVNDEVLAHIMAKLRMPEDSLHRIYELLQEPGQARKASSGTWLVTTSSCTPSASAIWAQL